MEKQFNLPKEFGEKWVNALRSGDYKQGTSYLSAIYSNGITAEQRYCCLGVACSMNGIKDDELRTEFIEDSLGMPAEISGDKTTNNLVRALTFLNDGEKGLIPANTFLEIVDWIEEHVNFI